MIEAVGASQVALICKIDEHKIQDTRGVECIKMTLVEPKFDLLHVPSKFPSNSRCSQTCSIVYQDVRYMVNRLFASKVYKNILVAFYLSQPIFHVNVAFPFCGDGDAMEDKAPFFQERVFTLSCVHDDLSHGIISG